MEEPPSYHSVQTINRSGLEIDLGQISRSVESCLEFVNAPPSDVRVLIGTDEEVAVLYLRYRGIAGPTDVLTFSDEDGFSGDIAIAAQYANRQSTVRGIPVLHELILLAIHGTLHLSGMNDELESDRLSMVHRMYEVASAMGIGAEEDWGSLLHQEEFVS